MKEHVKEKKVKQEIYFRTHRLFVDPFECRYVGENLKNTQHLYFTLKDSTLKIIFVSMDFFMFLHILQEKIVPPDPITTGEKKAVLQRLNQVIQYRLVSSELPQHMRKLKIGQSQNSSLQTFQNWARYHDSIWFLFCPGHAGERLGLVLS